MADQTLPDFDAAEVHRPDESLGVVDFEDTQDSLERALDHVGAIRLKGNRVAYIACDGKWRVAQKTDLQDYGTGVNFIVWKSEGVPSGWIPVPGGVAP